MRALADTGSKKTVDTGSKKTFVHETLLLNSATLLNFNKKIRMNVLDSVTNLQECVASQGITFLELSTNQIIVKRFEAHLVDVQASTFDVILGQDFNTALGMR